MLLAERGDHKRAAELFEIAGDKQRALAAWIDLASAKKDQQTHVSSIHPTGKVLSTSGARPIPIAPVVVEELQSNNRHWLRIALLLTLLGTLVLSAYWYDVL